MAKVLCVLYEDPVDGYPTTYAGTASPVIYRLSRRPDDPDVPSAVDLTPGGTARLGVGAGSGSVRTWRGAGTPSSVTSDKEGPDSAFDRELADADVVISQPFWPAYLTAARIARAPN